MADGFWSVTVYNKGGYFDISDRGVYSLNSKTVEREKDGSATIQNPSRSPASSRTTTPALSRPQGPAPRGNGYREASRTTA